MFAGQGRYMDLVKKADIKLLSLGGLEGKHLLKQARRKMVGAGMFTAEGLEAFIQLELKLIDQVKPDAIICDLQPSMAISAPYAGVPFISVTNAYLTRYAEDSVTDQIFHPLVRPILEPIRRRIASKPFRQLPSKYGIPRNTIFKDILTRGDLVLLPDIPEFAPTQNLPERFQYCGPLVWEPSNGSAAVLDELDPNQPTIYFTLGSTGLPEMFHRVLQDLKESEYQVILTTGSQVTPEELGPLPENFFVKPFFPGSAVLEHCHAVICHGGNGTIYQALGAGRPLVTIPTHVDQKANAFLLEKQGAGLIVDTDHMERVIPSLKRILSEPSYQENALRMKNLMSNLNGPGKAAGLIEDFLDKV